MTQDLGVAASPPLCGPSGGASKLSPAKPAAANAGDYFNAVPGRKGNWMQTYSGGQFWPLDMRPEDVFIEDIAHALSNICRYGGHCERFYSVAEHSVLVSRVVPPEQAMVGLLHDATEAYVGDVIRPLKPALADYKEIELGVWEAIAVRFGVTAEMSPEIKAADNAVLLAEQRQLMKPAPAPWCIEGEPAPVVILGLSPQSARELFLTRFAELAAQGMSARES